MMIFTETPLSKPHTLFTSLYKKLQLEYSFKFDAFLIKYS